MFLGEKSSPMGEDFSPTQRSTDFLDIADIEDILDIEDIDDVLDIADFLDIA